VSQKLLKARAVYGFWPAHSVGDDIVLFEAPGSDSEITRFPMLRQQAAAQQGNASRSLADFVAPEDAGLEDWIGGFAVTAGIGGLEDWIGGFAVTAGIGADELAAQYESAGDDYNAIMVKALADRLAEALAEWLHARARCEWGYGANESLDNEALIGEKYRGIRPAFGYPACPDHTPKRRLFELLEAPSVGIELTESCAMHPGASVSGLYFGHPEARYFNLGRVARDQVEDYAARSGMETDEAERWLSPNLGYDPASE